MTEKMWINDVGTHHGASVALKIGGSLMADAPWCVPTMR